MLPADLAQWRHLGDTSVGEDDVECAPGTLDGGCEVVEIGLLGDIGADGGGLIGADAGHRGAQRVVAPADQEDIRPGIGQRTCGGQPYPRCRPGDQSSFSANGVIRTS